MIITVTTEDVAEARNEGTVTMITGTREDGERVLFAGDWRAIDGLCDAVMAEGEIQAEVEAWQILGGAL
ncbi:MAG TPA: hypothetical protein VGI66_03530 [Streptosporangiaceae bacterium]|jgi:hypothetical protein